MIFIPDEWVRYPANEEVIFQILRVYSDIFIGEANEEAE